eukprot:COSAG02_NODE_407_length_22898_cov_135.264047_13_plen_92_part_00
MVRWLTGIYSLTVRVAVRVLEALAPRLSPARSQTSVRPLAQRSTSSGGSAARPRKRYSSLTGKWVAGCLVSMMCASNRTADTSKILRVMSV